MATVEELEVEVARLRKELDRAWRCIYGFYTSEAKGTFLPPIAKNYHSLTIGGAARWVREQSLEGAEYFVGKKLDVPQDALKLDLPPREEVFVRHDCIFRYCPTPPQCREACATPRRAK